MALTDVEAKKKLHQIASINDIPPHLFLLFVSQKVYPSSSDQLQLDLISSQTKTWKIVKIYTFQKGSYKFTTELIHAVFINDKYFAVIRVN